MSSNLLSRYRKKTDQIVITNTIESGTFSQVIHKVGSVSVTEVAMEKVVCFGFSFDTIGTKWL